MNRYLEKIAEYRQDPTYERYSKDTAKYGLAGAVGGALAGGALGSGSGLISAHIALKNADTFTDIRNPGAFKAFIKAAPRSLGKLGAEYVGKAGALAGVLGGITHAYMHKESADMDYRPAAALALGSGLTYSSAPHLLGYTKVYHGTSVGNADTIKKQGLDPAHGGKGASTIYDKYVDSSAGKSHVTRMRPVAEMYSRLSGELDGSRRGSVLAIRLPTAHWDKMMHDRDGGVNKYMAATTSDHIDSKYIAKHPFGGIAPHLGGQSLINHIKTRPGVFLRGVGGFAIGGTLAYNGVKGIYNNPDHVTEKPNV